MKKGIKLLLFSFILSFVFIINVRASECSYEERKELLYEAKNINAFFEPNLITNTFTFYLYGLSDNIYVTIESNESDIVETINNFDINGDYYSFTTNNVDSPISYKIAVYSNKSNCYGNKLTTKILKKGVINPYAKKDECDDLDDFYYCKPVLDKKITISYAEVFKLIYDYKYQLQKINESKVKKFNLIVFLKTYWYCFAIIFVIVVIVLLICFINKKRGELR